MDEILRGNFQFSTYIFEISTLFFYIPWQNSFFKKMSQQIRSDRHEMRKKNLIQRQQVVTLYQNFLAFFSLLYLEEERKQYQFRGGAICYKPPFPKQMMTNKEVFSPHFL